MTARGALAGVVAGVSVFLIAAASRVPVGFSDGEGAMLRLSWRMAGVTSAACRTPTEEELARLPVHMRSPQACIGQVASYALEVRAGGELIASDTVAPPGARGDRPLNVLRSFPLPAGDHPVTVVFRALLPEGVEPAEELAELSWQGIVRLAPRDVALVTLDGSGRHLELRTSPR